MKQENAPIISDIIPQMCLKIMENFTRELHAAGEDICQMSNIF